MKERIVAELDTNVHFNFEEMLHDYFGLPEGIHVYKEFAPLEGQTPEDYGHKTWAEVYNDVDAERVNEAIREYWDNPFTPEGWAAWDKAYKFIWDLAIAGVITDGIASHISERFCDNA